MLVVTLKEVREIIHDSVFYPFLRDILEFVVRETKIILVSHTTRGMQLLAHNKSINKSNVLAARNRRHNFN